MNWFWNKPRAMKWQKEKKQQREFFERQRFMATVKRLKNWSPGRSRENGISQDLLSIQTVNKTYHTKIGGQKCKINEVNLDQVKQPTRRYELDLGPVSPDKLCLPSPLDATNSRCARTKFGLEACKHTKHLCLRSLDGVPVDTSVNQHSAKEECETIPATPFQPFSKPGPKVTFSTRLQYSDNILNERREGTTVWSGSDTQYFWESETPTLSSKSSTNYKHGTLDHGSSLLRQSGSHVDSIWIPSHERLVDPGSARNHTYPERLKPHWRQMAMVSEQFQTTPLRKYEKKAASRKHKTEAMDEFTPKESRHWRDFKPSRSNEDLMTSHHQCSTSHGSILSVLDDRCYNHGHNGRDCSTPAVNSPPEISVGTRTVKSLHDVLEATPVIALSTHQSTTVTTTVDCINQYGACMKKDCSPTVNMGTEDQFKYLYRNRTSYEERKTIKESLKVIQLAEGKIDCPTCQMEDLPTEKSSATEDHSQHPVKQLHLMDISRQDANLSPAGDNLRCHDNNDAAITENMVADIIHDILMKVTDSVEHPTDKELLGQSTTDTAIAEKQQDLGNRPYSTRPQEVQNRKDEETSRSEENTSLKRSPENNLNKFEWRTMIEDRGTYFGSGVHQETPQIKEQQPPNHGQNEGRTSTADRHRNDNSLGRPSGMNSEEDVCPAPPDTRCHEDRPLLDRTNYKQDVCPRNPDVSCVEGEHVDDIPMEMNEMPDCLTRDVAVTCELLHLPVVNQYSQTELIGTDYIKVDNCTQTEDCLS